jgi:hypothetical protein
MLDEDALGRCFAQGAHSAGVAPNMRSGGVTPFVEKSLEEGVRED